MLKALRDQTKRNKARGGQIVAAQIARVQRRSINTLLELPVAVLCDSILSHLSVCDLQALDTAYTNKCQRPQLRQLWKSYRYDALHVVVHYGEARWLAGICAQIISIAVYDSTKSRCLTIIPTLKRLSIAKQFRCNMIWTLAINCPALEELYVYGSITVNAVSALAQNCRRLHTLYINSESVTNALTYSLTNVSLKIIGNSYPQLQKICVHSKNFTDDGLIYFAEKCHELQSVSVRGCNITSRGLTALWAANPNLMDADLSCNGFISDDDIIQLVQCCPLLQKLNIAFCEKVTDAAVIDVAEHCPQLRTLNMDGCNKVSDASLISLGQHCHKLLSINILYIEKISDAGIAALAAGCPLLQEFFIDNTNITDAGVVALAHGCRDLRKISLCGAISIGVAGISAIAQNCLLVSTLNIFGCTMVDNTSICAIAQHCRNLTILDISNTSVSDAEAVMSVIDSCRMLRELYCYSLRIKRARDQNAIKIYAGSRLKVFMSSRTM